MAPTAHGTAAGLALPAKTKHGLAKKKGSDKEGKRE